MCVSALMGVGSMEGCWGGNGAVWCDSGAKNFIPETKNSHPIKMGKAMMTFFILLLYSLWKNSIGNGSRMWQPLSAGIFKQSMGLGTE